MPGRPSVGQHGQAMTGAAKAAQHHRKLRLGRQRTVLAEVRPVGPFLLRQQQHTALVVLAELHLFAELAEQLELAAGQIVGGAPGHAL